jgi:phenylalanyl-tRNA synthetase alpha subunit
LGQKINQLASEIEEIFLLKEKNFNKEEKEEIDLTLPAKPTELGSLHPITQVKREMERIFQLMDLVLLKDQKLKMNGIILML